MFYAEVMIPPITRGGKQHSRMEVDKSHDLSRIRIHVERAIYILKSQLTLWNTSRGNHTVLSTILLLCVVHCVTAVKV